MLQIVKNALVLYESNLGWQNPVLDILFLSICHYLRDTAMLMTSAIKIWYFSFIYCLLNLPCILLLFSNHSPFFHLVCIDYCRSFEPIWPLTHHHEFNKLNNLAWWCVMFKAFPCASTSYLRQFGRNRALNCCSFISSNFMHSCLCII